MVLARKDMTMITFHKAILNTDTEKVPLSHNLKSTTVTSLVMCLLMQQSYMIPPFKNGVDLSSRVGLFSID